MCHQFCSAPIRLHETRMQLGKCHAFRDQGQRCRSCTVHSISSEQIIRYTQQGLRHTPSQIEAGTCHTCTSAAIIHSHGLCGANSNKCNTRHARTTTQPLAGHDMKRANVACFFRGMGYASCKFIYIYIYTYIGNKSCCQRHVLANITCSVVKFVRRLV